MQLKYLLLVYSLKSIVQKNVYYHIYLGNGKNIYHKIPNDITKMYNRQDMTLLLVLSLITAIKNAL